LERIDGPGTGPQVAVQGALRKTGSDMFSRQVLQKMNLAHFYLVGYSIPL